MVSAHDRVNRRSEGHSASHSLFSLRGRSSTGLWIVLQGLLMPLVAPVVLGAVELPLRGPSGETILGLGTLEAVAYSPDGRTIATSGSLGVFIWDVDTAPPIRWLRVHIGPVISVAFSPDGTRVLTGSRDDTAKLWDVETGAEIRTFSGHADEVHSVAFSPDGTRVLTAILLI